MELDNNLLAELLFPDVKDSIEDLEKRYPERALPEGARVTRFAPSPTGYLHIGAFYTALVNLLTAKASGGTSYLRIEDTDKKREIDDGVSAIINGFKKLGVEFSEGVTGFGTESGDYGPYTQSKRVGIYHTVAKELVKKGLAYPCFCTAEELSALREQEEKDGALITGYFGKYAKCRNLSFEEIKEKLERNEPYVLRFRSFGDENRRIVFDDMIRGKIEMPENVIDEVLLKSDGIPTYHFAHVCDDHFMRTTHVIRAEEWLSSVPKHIALFKACGFKVPKYAHVSQVMKLDEDDGNKRKISKRKDPEAAVSYFFEAGVPKESITEYLLTLINSNFEDWRRANPKASAFDFPFNLKKMSSSGCLFDLVKLADVSKNVISVMDADTVYSYISEWAKEYDPEFYEIFTKNPERSREIVNIDRENPKPRKDIAKWSEVKDYFSYMFNELYTPAFELPENISKDDAAAILKKYRDVYDASDGKDEWFNKLKDICEPLGFTPNVKEYKKSPDSFKGHVGDISTVIRLAVTSRRNTPDLCSIMRLLGKEEALRRIDDTIKSL
ncbi:MAG: glutamate--tRNA ligase [Oscillospiraceae bacterium]|nr:glutamate--tRNA ligase [Oscillospiraceae bacterium]MDY2678193.1 glutamate--tRNA ligase [Oscillospiraceae bacterium]